MSKPHLDSVNFAKLSKNKDKTNYGTVTGSHIKVHDKVTIVSHDSGIVWTGEITGNLSGNTWNAEVKRVPDEKAVETVGVTVTNNEGDSNEVTQKSDVIP